MNVPKKTKWIFLASCPYTVCNAGLMSIINGYSAAHLPFFRSILILLPLPLLLVRLARPGTGLLLSRGLWLLVLGVGEELAALPGSVGETLAEELYPDWSSAGDVFTERESGVLARVSGRLTSSLPFGLVSCLGSGWGSVLARTAIGLFAFTVASLPSPVKS